MKHKLSIISTIFLIALLMLSQLSTTEARSKKKFASYKKQTAKTQRTKVAAIVTKVVGTLNVYRYGSSKPVKANAGIFLYEGDRIVTEKNSKAAMIFSSGAEMKISQNTQITIESSKLEQQMIQNTVKLKRGTVYSRTAGLRAKLAVNTPVAVVAVRGTEYETDVDDKGNTEILVIEGTVYVFNDLGGVEVNKGEKTAVKSGKSPDPASKASADDLKKSKEWQKDVTIDKKIVARAAVATLKVNQTCLINIDVLNSSDGTLDTKFNGTIAIGKTQDSSIFSADNGKTWTAAKVTAVNGKASILFKDSKPGTAGLAFIGDKVDPGTIAIEVTLPASKTLEMKLKTDTGEEKKLYLKFGR